jgi:hypothetical protein
MSGKPLDEATRVGVNIVVIASLVGFAYGATYKPQAADLM